MSDLEARFRVRLEGAGEVSTAMKRMGKDALDMRKIMVGAFADSAKQIAGFAISTGKSLGALATGNIGIANQAKQVLQFRDSVSALAVMAGKGEDSLGGLRDQIHAVSKSSNQMQDDVTGALAAFVEKTGDLETARNNLALYGKVATATGASIKDIALVGVELSDKLGIKQQSDALAILAKLSKEGSIELADLATKGPRLLAAAASAGAEGQIGLRKTGALAQVYAQGFGGKGSAASVTTAAERTFSDIATHGKQIRALGINTRGADGKARDQFEVLREIVEKAGGDETKLRQIFGVISMRGVSVLSRKGFGDFDRFKDIKPSATMLDDDFKARTNTGESRLKSAQISIAASSDKNLGDSFDKLAHHADKLAGAFDFATRHIALTAGVAGISIIGKNVGTSMLSVAMLKAAAGGGGALGAGAPVAATAFATAAAPIFAALAGAAIGGIIGTAIDQYFGISDGVSKSLVANKNKQIEKAADERLDVRARGVKYFEGRGQTHGQAMKSQMDVEGLEKIFERLNKQTNQIAITIINDRIARADSGGTRSDVSLALRGMDGIDRARP